MIGDMLQVLFGGIPISMGVWCFGPRKRWPHARAMPDLFHFLMGALFFCIGFSIVWGVEGSHGLIFTLLSGVVVMACVWLMFEVNDKLYKIRHGQI